MIAVAHMKQARWSSTVHGAPIRGKAANMPTDLDPAFARKYAGAGHLFAAGPLRMNHRALNDVQPETLRWETLRN